MCDDREDFNIWEDDEPVQTTRISGKSRPKKVNTKSSKAENLWKKNTSFGMWENWLMIKFLIC